MELITAIEKVDELLKEKGRLYFYKHSTRCSVSSLAKENLDRFLSKNKREIYQVNVVESRDVSNYVEKITQIRHESPQLIVLKNKEVEAHCSHWAIDENFFQEHLT